MTPTIESTLADHHARLNSLEREQEDTSKKLDNLRNWIMTTLATVVAGLIVSLLKK
jgi:hypothetical protein